MEKYIFQDATELSGNHKIDVLTQLLHNDNAVFGIEGVYKCGDKLYLNNEFSEIVYQITFIDNDNINLKLLYIDNYINGELVNTTEFNN